jgi:large subunit ribosomal protein L3
MLPLRTGALAIKKGMTGMYDPETAKRIPCTVLQLDRCQVISHKRRDKHGYWAVQVGSGTKEARNVTRPERGHFAAQEVSLKRHLAEFRVKNEDGLPEVGSVITADLFQEGQFVDARAVTRGMGFAGGMKRWGWSGQPASHGTSLTHRAMGSAGGSQGSGSRVIPGKKMPGRMGGEMHTVQNLKIMKVDAENGIVVVHGAVPGPKKGMVKIQDAIKKPWPDVDLAMGLSVGGGMKILPMAAEA